MLQFDDVEALRRRHSAWRLLRADNAPLILSFLGRVFVEENVRTITAAALADRLDDELYALRQRLGEDAYPKTAKAYLDDWATPESGWLRKYYPAGSDDPHMDATPAVEKALGWVESLATRSFVGTESRLNTVFELLRQMAFGAETDPEARLTELRRRRDEIDADIARVESGRVDLLDAVGQRDRYQQFTSTARELLADFREVEDNFRNLDRELREQIAGWSGSKGELLDEVLGSRSSIRESDQGRSFHAFYDFLLSSSKQAEFTRTAGARSVLGDRRRDRPAHAAHPLRLAGRRRTDPGHRPDAVRAVAPLPRRSGLAGEPARDGHSAQHRSVRAAAADRAESRHRDRDRRHRTGNRAADGAPALHADDQGQRRQLRDRLRSR